MKHLLFIFLLTPCLCFAQLGINTQNPEAVLHIIKKNNQNSLPSLKIEGLEDKKEKENQSYSNLIIYPDGTIKKAATEAHIGNKFYFNSAITLTKSGVGKDAKKIPVKNFTNDKAVNNTGQIVIPTTGTYAFSFRFYGITTGAVKWDDYSFGQVILRISATDSSGNTITKQEVPMEWITASTENKMSHSANTSASFKKGDIVHISLEKLAEPINGVLTSIILKKAAEDNDSKATSFIMYRL